MMIVVSPRVSTTYNKLGGKFSHPPNKKLIMTESKTKICTKCKILKEVFDFNKNKSNLDGYESQCRKCVNTRKRKNKKNYKKLGTVKLLCIVCEQEFIKYQSSQKCCSNKCSIIHKKRQCKQYEISNQQKRAEQHHVNYIANKEEILKRSHKHYKENKKAHSILTKRYYKENKERIDKKQKEWVKKNRDKRIAQARDWRVKNKDRINKQVRDRRKTDINFRLTLRLRSRLRAVLKGTYKSAKTLELIGCSIEFLKEHIENQFQSGMNWEKFKNGEIHIDHKKPCCSFDLSKPEQQRECFGWQNLQPLYAVDNLKKGGKF